MRTVERTENRAELLELLRDAARSGLPEALDITVAEAARILLEWRNEKREQERQADAEGWYYSRVESCRQPFWTW